MVNMSAYGLTPEQYHHGLDLLWDALPEDYNGGSEHVFGKVAARIAELEAALTRDVRVREKRILKLEAALRKWRALCHPGAFVMANKLRQERDQARVEAANHKQQRDVARAELKLLLDVLQGWIDAGATDAGDILAEWRRKNGEYAEEANER